LAESVGRKLIDPSKGRGDVKRMGRIGVPWGSKTVWDDVGKVKMRVIERSADNNKDNVKFVMSEYL
jgi:hypothetical protein